MTIRIFCEQGSPEWLQARSGVTTASKFKDAVSKLTRTSGQKKAGDPTDASDKYACDIAIERISGKPYGEPPKAWTLERGHEMEELARIAYETRYNVMVNESGIMLTDDRRLGYSTDGEVDDGEGLIEIKAPVDSLKIAAMWRTGDVSDYYHQMQGGLFISGRKYCDFIMYVPDLASVGKDLFVKRIYRDENFIETMVDELMAFERKVQEYENLFRMKEAV